jgi:2-C-methyl-D-erythritol 4-phosphate cytidylyltransferase
MTSGNEPSHTMAVIPAAGAGVRMGKDRAKQFLDLNGRPILAVTLDSFEKCRGIHGIVLVVPPRDLETCQNDFLPRYGFNKIRRVVAGGKERQDSVRMGLEALPGNCERVLIHDGVRPLVTLDLIQRILAASDTHRAVIAALPAKETVKEVDDSGKVITTLERSRICLVQTPQVFLYADILAAHRSACRENWQGITDDARLAEKAGIPVHVIPGEEENIKVTTPFDLEWARILMLRRQGLSSSMNPDPEGTALV